MSGRGELPALPEPAMWQSTSPWLDSAVHSAPLFTDDQMHAYAAACVAQERERSEQWERWAQEGERIHKSSSMFRLGLWLGSRPWRKA